MITMEEGLEDIGRKFKVGAVYIATPAQKGQLRRLGVVIGKSDAMLQVAFVDELVVGRTEQVEGHDYAILKTRSGQYNISACVKANAADAAIVNDILEAQRKAVGK